ncbi:cell division protein ZapE [Brytella acorum]|uniref:Cell division protein ZapE n=1 Tax=Brytella acorum TaxID=2959299 RepID=A0AA35V0M2_9PROT|nr:cell division protein ZapE [Brytella acorum]MDF3623413.1 cell division protein ZapE [Brytella acorum]CAI9120520.1 cell division protein ZapE [Brytella acorum]
MSSNPALAWMPANATLSQAYALGVSKGLIQRDEAQEKATRVLDRLAERLAAREKENASLAKGFWSRLTKTKPDPIEGVYLVGDVGRGKSMLMDMFCQLVPVEKKQRIHFHAFMQEAHKALFALQKLPKLEDDPVTALAKDLSKKYTLICFDEFQMHDMSDAVVILRLLNALISMGTVFVATSNTAPEDLLAGNVGRTVMLPFIRTFASHMRVVHLQAARDYRRGRDEDDTAWIVPADDAARKRLDAVFAEYATGPAEPTELAVGSRHVPIPLAAGRIARFDFDDLCDRALGPADYLALGAKFPVVIIDDIPLMDPDSFDKARRFITLIDVFYEQHTVLFASAACMPEQLYRSGENAQIFERTASRLEEMRSRTWLAAAA